MKPSVLRSAKPVILTFVRYYLPGYKSGGPIRTIANLVEALGDEFDFHVVTSDRDATDTAPYPEVVTNGEWITVRKAKVLYISQAQKSLPHIGKILREAPHDVLYLNSFFDSDFTQKPLFARRLGLAPKTRCVIAPRGEFSTGALQLKAWKKTIFLQAARLTGLYRDLIWQASSEHEVADIRRVMGHAARNIKVAANLPDASASAPTPHRPRAQGEPLRVCFLSRISPMKNLDFALEILRQVRTPLRFDIYGPVRDEGYWRKCRTLMGQLPDSVKAAYQGSVEHAEISSVLGSYDLFFLPTRGENYGHAILDAFAGGTPVLIADTTPWRNLADAGIGWDLPLGKPEAFVEKIEYVARLSAAEATQMRVCAVSFAERHRTNGDAIETNGCLFTQALA